MQLMRHDIQNMLVGLHWAHTRKFRTAHFIKNGLQQQAIMLLFFFQIAQEIDGSIIQFFRFIG